VRIGFDAKRLFNNFTGLGNYSRFVVKALAENYPQNQHLLFSPKVRHHPDTDYFFENPAIEIVNPPATVSSLKLGSIWRTFALGLLAKKHQCEVFHGLSHELPRGLTDGIKKIVTIHDLIFCRYPQFYNPVDVAIYKSKVKHACRVADQIVAISEQTRNDIVEFLKIDEKKISVVYQGCHENFNRKCTAEEINLVRDKYSLPSRYLLNVGTIESRKNVLLAVEALRNVDSEVHLVIVGRSTEYFDKVQKYILHNSLGKRVHFIHKVSFADLPAIYAQAEIFIYPSLFEGFGIPLVEAIKQEVPVITSTGSCFREAAGPDAVYVDPNNANELSARINQILNDKSLRNSMVSKSREYIRRFEPSVIASELMKVYQS